MQLKFLRLSVLVILFFLGVAQIAVCGDLAGKDKNPDILDNSPKIESSGFEMAIRLIISIVIITLLIYISVWCLKKMSSYKPGRGSTANNIEIIDNSYLGPKKGLHVVKAGSKYILVASSENSMSFICELNSEDFQNQKTNNPTVGQQGMFKEMLEKLKAGAEKPFLRRTGNADSSL